MILVLQRVTAAAVRVGGAEVGAIGRGLLVLAAIERNDRASEVDWCAKKVAEVRMFSEDNGKMNLSVRDVGGGVLVVSQFTLAGNLKKGTRPSFSKAAPPDDARPLFERFVEKLKALGLVVATGVFRANMEVELVNDGPVTLILERRWTHGNG